MEKTKDEIIADLYALRAGLSVISENADNAKEYSKKADNCTTRKNSLIARRDEAEKSLELCNDELTTSKRNNLYNYLPDPSSNDYNRAVFKRALKNANMFKFFLAIFLGGGAAFASLFFQIGLFSGRWDIGALVGIIMTFLVVLILIIVMIVNVRRAAKDIKEIHRNKLLLIQKCIFKVKDAQNELDTIKNLLPTQLNSIYVEQDSYLLVERKCISDSEAVVFALQDKYGDLLSPSDWENLDLVIFYLNTGRADTIKECLQLVDRQRQTESIVDAIETASYRISNEINSGFQMLGRTMVTCFNALSEQVNSISVQLDNQHIQVMNALSNVENQNNTILTTAKLNAALSAKASVNSEKLVEDMNYVKTRLNKQKK